MGHLTAGGVRLVAGGRTLVRDAHFDARPGQITAIVGPNGSGKTTLLRVLAGVSRPVAGSVRLDGVAVARMSSGQRARLMTLLGSDATEPALTVREAVSTGRFAHHPWWDWRRTREDAASADEAIERVGLGALADRPFDTLSSGERQRAWIALALAQGANVLLLDEPTSHLDVRYAHDVLALLRAVARDDATVVVVLHDLNQAAEYADRVALIAGESLLGPTTPANLLDATTLERAYGVSFTAVDIGGARRVFSSGTKQP
jgi:ABC-type cobalamin/Fe3+-siderophores transport system ATPase subunit